MYDSSFGTQKPKEHILYTLNGGDLKTPEAKKDLEDWVSTDLKPRNHIASVAPKGNKIIGRIRRNFTDIDEDV